MSTGEDFLSQLLQILPAFAFHVPFSVFFSFPSILLPYVYRRILIGLRLWFSSDLMEDFHTFVMFLNLREKKKIEERAATQKANEAVTKCLADYQSVGR